MSKIEIRGCTVEKIVRANGKAEAQMVITILVDSSIEAPLGKVTITLEEQQPGMFGKAELPRKKAPGASVRGDRS